jgi:competence protein ComEC
MAGACLAGGWVSVRLSRPGVVVAYIVSAAFFLGGASLALSEQKHQTHPLHALGPGAYEVFSGRLTRSPSRGLDQDHLFLRVEAIERNGAPRPCSGTLRITAPHSTTFPRGVRLLAGDRVRVSARISAPVEFRNFGPPRSDRYLRSQGLDGLAYCKSALFIEPPAPRRGFSLPREASRLRQSFQDRIERYFPGDRGTGLSQPGAVLEALLLGERRRMDPDVTLDFQESGLLHLIAISGAHIGIVSLLLLAAFRTAGLGPRASAMALAAALVFYATLVEGTPSVLRATIMAVWLILARLSARAPCLLNALASSFLFLLVLEPSSLFDPGFELTYAATLSIVLFRTRILRVLPHLPLKVNELLAMSLAAQAGALPILAGAFHRVALAPLVLNLAAIPLVAAIMAAGYVFLPVTWISGALAGLLGRVLRLLLGLLLWTSRQSDASPLLSFRVPDPPWPAVLGFYGFLLALLVRRRFRFQTAPLLAGLGACLVLIAFPPGPPPLAGLRVTFLDVGQGDAILVELPGRSMMLVDGGGSPTSPFDPGERVVSPVLWRRGASRLALIAATHAHPDHMRGLQSVARNFRPAELWESPPATFSTLRERMESALPPRAVRRRLSRGYRRVVGGVAFDVLHPGPGRPSERVDENDRSLVLRLVFGRTAFLLTGDIGRAAEDEILGSGLPLGSGVLKVGHHGSDSSSTPAFLERVRPRVAVVTVGLGNSYGLPRPAALARLRAAGATVYRTDRDGAVEVTSNGRTYAVRTAREPDRVRVYR